MECLKPHVQWKSQRKAVFYSFLISYLVLDMESSAGLQLSVNKAQKQCPTGYFVNMYQSSLGQTVLIWLMMGNLMSLKIYVSNCIVTTEMDRSVIL